MDLLSDGRLLMGMASGWYRREFDAIGVPFEQRGKIMDENLDILKRFWTEHMVSGKFTQHNIPGRRHVSEAGAEAASADPDRRIRRSRAQARRRRPATAGSPISTGPRASPNRGARSAASPKEAGKDPDKLLNASQLPIYDRQVARRRSRAQMMEWLTKEWDFASWSESTQGQRHHGNGRRMRRAAQGAHRGRRAEDHLRPLQVPRWSRSRSSRARSFPRLKANDGSHEATETRTWMHGGRNFGLPACAPHVIIRREPGSRFGRCGCMARSYSKGTTRSGASSYARSASAARTRRMT